MLLVSYSVGFSVGYKSHPDSQLGYIFLGFIFIEVIWFGAVFCFCFCGLWVYVEMCVECGGGFRRVFEG